MGKKRNTLGPMVWGDTASFREKLITWMERESISEYELADKLGVARSTVGMWKQRGSIPKGPVLRRLAELMGVSTEDLIDAKARHPGAGDPNALSPAFREPASVVTRIAVLSRKVGHYRAAAWLELLASRPTDPAWDVVRYHLEQHGLGAVVDALQAAQWPRKKPPAT